jgi:plasmid stabilization system protein ParE
MPLKVAYLDQAARDAVWMNHYYEGARRGLSHYLRAVTLLSVNPRIGRVLEKKPRRCFSVPATPFAIVYQQRGETLEIVRILDQRSATYLAALFEKT